MSIDKESLKSEGIEIKGAVSEGYDAILTLPALKFLAKLVRKFEAERQRLLKVRQQRHAQVDQGNFPDFLPETQSVRDGDWKVAKIPQDLLKRRVEITGPVERKMIINALNSGADVFMADFEDSNSPTWANVVEGQINLRDAVDRTIRLETPKKTYELNPEIATLLVRPRGWHLSEKHVLVDGEPVSASLFDFALFFFHNVKTCLKNKTAPYFYLPKMESHLEARLWNDVFKLAQQELGVPQGTIRATVLIETIWAGFEMDEILHELREHSAGLNCGRWDYIFSFIKTFRNHADFVLPDRAQITMDKAFLSAYVELLIQTCHKRGIHAMGGMAPQIPIKSDPAANQAALEKVRKDKEREVLAGHDGTWVAHPGLVEEAKAVFDQHMKTDNQIDKKRKDMPITAKELLSIPEGKITEKGIHVNVNVGILYLEAWLRGSGCVPLYNLMEDAATAEISRTQVWQWIHHQVKTDEGIPVTADLIKTIIQEEMQSIEKQAGAETFKAGKFELAARLFEELCVQKDCPDFLTLKAYEYLA